MAGPTIHARQHCIQASDGSQTGFLIGSGAGSRKQLFRSVGRTETIHLKIYPSRTNNKVAKLFEIALL
jgi:hypothetical protein